MQMTLRGTLSATLLAVTAPVSIAFAQSAPVPVPQVEVRTLDAMAAARVWPALDVRVDRDAYVTVFAVTRGGGDLPIQVLSPGAPGDNGKLKAGQRYQPRSLSSAGVLHLAEFGQAPLVVAFASNVKPNLKALADGRRWSNTLFVADSAAPDLRGLANALAMEIYGLNVPYSVSVRELNQPVPENLLPAGIGAFASGRSSAPCASAAAEALRELRSVGVQSGLGLGAAFVPGAVVEIGGGQRVTVQRNPNPTGNGCGEYRIAYLPRVDLPLGSQTRTTRADNDSTYVQRPSANGADDRLRSGGVIPTPEPRKAPKAQPDAHGAVSAPFEPSRTKSEPKTDTKVEKTETKVEAKSEAVLPSKTPPGAHDLR